MADSSDNEVIIQSSSEFSIPLARERYLVGRPDELHSSLLDAFVEARERRDNDPQPTSRYAVYKVITLIECDVAYPSLSRHTGATPSLGLGGT